MAVLDLDFADLQDVAPLVRRNQERPLIGIAVLSLHEAAA
jgi:hypothetical protein